MDRWSSEIGKADDVYVGQRLAYRESFAEGDIAFGKHEGSLVLQLLLRTWLVATFLWSIIFVFLMSAGVFDSPQSSAFSMESEPEPVPWNLLTLVWFLCFVVAGLIRERQWASQWQYVIDDQAAAAEVSYAAIVETIRRRQLPLAAAPRAIRSDLGGEIRWYLVLRFREYSAYVGVFGFGTSLYMSWSMWRDELTLAVFWRYFIETISGSAHIDQILRADPARAMRDAVHNAVREGLEAAITGRGPSIHDALQGNFPILETAPGDKTAPAPGPAPAPAPRPASAPAPGPGSGPASGPAPGPASAPTAGSAPGPASAPEPGSAPSPPPGTGPVHGFPPAPASEP